MTNKPWRWPFLAGLLPRLLLPWYGHGFRYMDEHWQVIEPANHLIHGRAWSITTEWQQGLRSWIYPWLVSLPMRLAELLGLQDPIWINAFVRMIQGALSALAIPLTYATVRRLLPDRSPGFAAAAAWLVALWPISIYVGFHTQGEFIGALLVLAAVAAPVLVRREALAYALSGAAFGAALAIKIDLAVAGLGYGIWQLATGKFRRAGALVAGVVPFVLLVGLVDRLAWGSWFHSVLGHATANLVEGVGNQWGVSPWYTHVLYYFDLASVPALVACATLPWSWRSLPGEARGIWFMNAFFVAVFAAIPHKEKRFIAPLLYSAQVAAWATLAALQRRVSWPHVRRYVFALAALLAVHAGANAVTYLAHRPWWDRIKAMHDAGAIPGIQKMFSPQWPAVFYLPRHIAAAPIDADAASIAEATKGLSDIGVATDWKDLSPFTVLGFKCVQWPEAAPVSTTDTVPLAYHCTR